MKLFKRSERALIYCLSFLIGCVIFAVLALPFVLAMRFGNSWLYLNFVTVPAYLAFVFYIDRRAKQ